MKRLVPTLALLALLVATPAFAQQGTVHEHLLLESELMGQQVHYAVYLPPDYETSSRSYPIVYLLHGYTDDDVGWIQMGEMNRILDDAIANGELPPMVVVMPDGGVTWYIDSADGSAPWERMFLDEMMPAVESEYRVRVGKRYRGIAGLSMGGWGSLTLSMRNPELFSGAAALSAAVFQSEAITQWDPEGYDRMLGPVFGAGLQGQERLSDHFLAHSPLELAGSLEVESLRSVRYWIDCGDDDFLTTANGRLHAVMREREIPHEYRVRDGAHVWEYWRTGLVPALGFIAESFR